MSSDKGKETVSGWASADGNTVLLGGSKQQADGSNTGYKTELLFGVRSGPVMDNAALSGKYQLIGGNLGYWQSTGGNPTTVSNTLNGLTVQASFDGSGGCSVSFSSADYSIWTDNVGNGNVNVGSNAGTSTACGYSVSQDGSFTLNITFPEDTVAVTGWAGADGNTVVIGGPTQKSEQGGTNYQVELMVGTRLQ
jgi:hypothetical protein